MSLNKCSFSVNIFSQWTFFHEQNHSFRIVFKKVFQGVVRVYSSGVELYTDYLMDFLFVQIVAILWMNLPLH